MDKDSTHTDSQFIDHSWQEMSSLLDHEMPVQKRKRRPFWLFFFGIGLLGLISLSYFTANKKTKLQSFTIQEKTKIATIKVLSSDKNKVDIASKKIAIKPIVTKSSDDIYKKSASNIITRNSSTAAKTSTAMGAAIPKTNKVKTEFPIQLKIKQQDKINLIETSRRWQTVSPAIPSRPITTLKYKRQQLLGLVSPIPKNKSSKWRVGSYAGLLTPKLGSFRTGLFTNVTLNKKWSVHIGLGYAQRSVTSNGNKNNVLGNLLAVPLETEADMNATLGTSPNPIGSGLTNEMELSTNSGIALTNFHYFEMPLLVQYQIRPKLAIEIGGNLSYLHGYHYQYNDVIFFSKDNNLKTTFDNIGINLSVVDLPNISTVNLSLVGGVNYQISKKLNAYTNYHYSNNYLRNTPTSTFSEKRWQQIEVGIRYFFK